MNKAMSQLPELNSSWEDEDDLDDDDLAKDEDLIEDVSELGEDDEDVSAVVDTSVDDEIKD